MKRKNTKQKSNSSPGNVKELPRLFLVYLLVAPPFCVSSSSVLLPFSQVHQAISPAPCSREGGRVGTVFFHRPSSPDCFKYVSVFVLSRCLFFLFFSGLVVLFSQPRLPPSLCSFWPPRLPQFWLIVLLFVDKRLFSGMTSCFNMLLVSRYSLSCCDCNWVDQL